MFSRVKLAQAAFLAFVVAWSSFGQFYHYQTTKAAHGHADEKAKNIAEAEKADERIARYNFWLTIFTGVLGAVAFVQIYFLNRSDKTATITANAAKESGDAAIAAERAWLLLEIESNNFREALTRAGVFALGETGIPTDMPPTVRFRFRNYGKTPAFVKEICRQFEHLTELPEELRYVRDIDFDGPYIVGAGEATRSQSGDPREPLTRVLGAPFDAGAADNLRKGESFLWFYGRVVYDDVWGNERVSRFCWVYDGFLNRFAPFNGKPYNENT